MGEGGGRGESDASTTWPSSWIAMDTYTVCLRVRENSIDSKKEKSIPAEFPCLRTVLCSELPSL